MSIRRFTVLSLATVLFLCAAAPAFAVRTAARPLLLGRLAISGYAGGGLPMGEFADDLDGDGNHASWPLDYAVEAEFFAGRTWSLGFSAANTTYEDKTFPELETHVSTYSGFVRIVMPTATPVRPYFRVGMGGVEIQFQDDVSRVDAEYEFSFQAGGGLLWLPARWLGLSAQALYYNGSTSEAYISENNTIVGFDTKYWVFAGGVSLFFP